jgi:hypothetical protein
VAIGDGDPAALLRDLAQAAEVLGDERLAQAVTTVTGWKSEAS